MDHPLLYEINTRCWLRDLSDETGERVHLGNIPDSELDHFVRHGFSHVWLMGVWKTAELSREQALRSRQLRAIYDDVLPNWQPEDVAGSPYAIGEYNVPSEIGGNDGLADFRRRLNDRGIKLLLDFVPNHVGLGNSWLQFWPELFVRGIPGSNESFKWHAKDEDHWIAHGKDPYFPAWVDTAQLDLRRTDTQKALLDTLQIVANQCDGVRCDMAMLILKDVFEETWSSHRCPVPHDQRDFWAHAIPAIKENHPEFLFIAEAYWDLEPRLLELGFDYAYNKWLYDHLQNDNGAEAVAHLRTDKGAHVAHGVHFLENHDEPRAARTFTRPEHRAAAILTFCLPGMRLIHEGQLTGAESQIPVQLARRAEGQQDDYLFSFYVWLLRLLRASSIGHGKYKILTPFPAWSTNETHNNVVVIQWQKEPGKFEIVTVNPTDGDAQCFVHPEIPELHRHQWKMTDLLGAATFDRYGIELRH